MSVLKVHLPGLLLYLDCVHAYPAQGSGFNPPTTPEAITQQPLLHFCHQIFENIVILPYSYSPD